MKKEQIDYIKSLISMDELESALEEIQKLEINEYFDDLILIKARFIKLNRMNVDGLYNIHDYNLDLNRLRFALLEFLKLISPNEKAETTEDLEDVYNVFLFVDYDEIIKYFSIIKYEVSGDDEVKLNFLKNKVKSDYNNGQLYRINSTVTFISQSKEEKTELGFPLGNWEMVKQNGSYTQLFEEAFRDLNAPRNPLLLTTIIEKGKPYINEEKVKTYQNRDTELFFRYVTANSDWDYFHFERLFPMVELERIPFRDIFCYGLMKRKNIVNEYGTFKDNSVWTVNHKGNFLLDNGYGFHIRMYCKFLFERLFCRYPLKNISNIDSLTIDEITNCINPGDICYLQRVFYCGEEELKSGIQVKSIKCKLEENYKLEFLIQVKNCLSTSTIHGHLYDWKLLLTVVKVKSIIQNPDTNNIDISVTCLALGLPTIKDGPTIAEREISIEEILEKYT